MEKNQSSRRHTIGNGIPRSPHTLRIKTKTGTTTSISPAIPPFTSNSGRKYVDRSNSSTRTKTTRSSSSKIGLEENKNPSATTIPIPEIMKKPPDYQNLVIRNLQRHHQSHDVIKAIEKLKATGSVSPSAWALSPGRSSSSIFPMPPDDQNLVVRNLRCHRSPDVFKIIEKVKKAKGTGSISTSSRASSPGRSSYSMPPYENLIVKIPDRKLQRHRKPDIIKTPSVSPSAWALSPGRTSSSIFPMPIDENLVVDNPDQKLQRHPDWKTKGTLSVSTSSRASSPGRSSSSIFPVLPLKKVKVKETGSVCTSSRTSSPGRSSSMLLSDEKLIVISPGRNLQRRYRNSDIVKIIEKVKTKKKKTGGSVCTSSRASSPGRSFSVLSDEKLVFRNNLQRRHRSPDVVKTIEKVKTKKKTGSVSLSPWALSPGRSSSIFPIPESPDYYSGTTTTTTTTTKPPRSGSSSVLNCFRQKKVSSSVQEEAFHQLRIMHTRLLQWRFANARAESRSAAKKCKTEEKIFKVWVRIFHLRKSILEKRLLIQKLKQEIKIIRTINPQLCILNEWEKIEKKNSEAVARIGRKLSASSAALPLINGAEADTDSVQNAMLTAMGVIKNIEATITKFTSQVEETGSLAFKLVNTVEQEKKGLEELRKEIAIVASLKAEKKSLRAQVIQAATQQNRR